MNRTTGQTRAKESTRETMPHEHRSIHIPGGGAEDFATAIGSALDKAATAEAGDIIEARWADRERYAAGASGG